MIFCRPVLISLMIVTAGFVTRDASAEPFHTSVSGAVMSEGPLYLNTDPINLASGTISDGLDNPDTGSVQGSIDTGSPVRFHAFAQATSANDGIVIRSEVSLGFDDTLEVAASQSLLLQFEEDPNLRFYILERLAGGSSSGTQTVNLSIQLNSSDLAHSQSITAPGVLRIDLTPDDEFDLGIANIFGFTAGNRLSGRGLDASNSMTATAVGDFRTTPSSTAAYLDTAHLMYFYLTDGAGNPLDGLTITGGSGNQYPVNVPLPTPEPPAFLLLTLGVAGVYLGGAALRVAE